VPESITIEHGGVSLRLTGDPAIVCDQHRTAFIADLHLGKSATYRASGVPVPEATTGRDLDRLAGLIDRDRIETLIVLGDLAHAPAWRNDATIGAVVAWRDRHAGLSIVCVRGNHDRRAGRFPEGLRIEEVDEPHEWRGLDLLHDPALARGRPSLSGHIHPVMRLGPTGRRSRRPVRARCFWLRGATLVLPTFGSFTGGAVVAPGEGDRVWLTDGGLVAPASTANPARRADVIGLDDAAESGPRIC